MPSHAAPTSIQAWHSASRQQTLTSEMPGGKRKQDLESDLAEHVFAKGPGIHLPLPLETNASQASPAGVFPPTFARLPPGLAGS